MITEDYARYIARVILRDHAGAYTARGREAAEDGGAAAREPPGAGSAARRTRWSGGLLTIELDNC